MESLVVFARQPVAGDVKTRLAESIGHDAAVALYCAFLEDTAATCAQWRTQTAAGDPNRRLVLAVDPSVEDPILVEIARRGGMHLAEQGGGDLGDRLGRAMESEFSRGARAVCVIGSDSPTLPRFHLDQAFRALLFERVVFGPSFDGGYWLVGATRPAPDLFGGIPWSKPNTLDESLRNLRAQGLHAHLLPYWFDIDTLDDVAKLATQLVSARDERPNAFAATYAALAKWDLLHLQSCDHGAQRDLRSKLNTTATTAAGGHT